MNKIEYKSGYNYQLTKTYTIQTNIKPPKAIKTKYASLSLDGILTVEEGYAWDGATDAFDTITFMRGSLVHDALYGLMRMELLDATIYRIQADKLLRDICLEDGMWGAKADLAYALVRKFGAKAAMRQNENTIKTAP